jgi:hypothetical protein|tara:strand:+ start:791 stop:2614 length:1824 start_codon:yes stop_codon:yes gene_type:complete
MAMNTPFSEFAGGINSTVDAYRANPAPLQQEVRQNSKKPLVDQSLVKLIAASMLNEEQKAKEQEINRALNPPVNTVADQTINQLTRNKEMEIARRVGMVNQQKAQEQRKKMDAMGIGGLPTSMNQRTMPQQRPTMQAAGGGIVAFDEGGDVAADDEPQTYGQYFMDIGTDFASDIGEWALENPTLATAIGYAPGAKLAKYAGKIPKGYKAVKEAVKESYDKFKRVRKARKEKPELFDKVKTPPSEKAGAAVDTITKPKVVVPVVAGAGAAEFLTTPMGGEGEETEAGPQRLDYAGTTVEQEPQITTTPDFEAGIQDALTTRRTGIDALSVPSINPDLSVSAVKQEGDAARAAKQKRTDEIIEKLREGKVTLGTQIDEGMSKRDDALKQMQERADMLAGRGDYQQAARVKEFLNSLATVGGGRNLGEGLARGLGASLAQEDVRRLRGAEADKEIAGFQAETADKLIQNAKDMFGLESEIAFKAEEYLSDIDQMNADTAAKMLQAQALDTEVQKLGLSLQQSNIEAGFEADLQKIQTAVDLFKVAATRDINLRQQNVELLGDYNSGITELVTAINSQLTNEEDKKKLLVEVTRIQGIVDTLTKSLNLTK